LPHALLRAGCAGPGARHRGSDGRRLRYYRGRPGRRPGRGGAFHREGRRTLSDRFRVTYHLSTGDAAEARGRAEAIALEQTVEIPRDVVPAGFVEDVILGQVEAVAPDG